MTRNRDQTRSGPPSSSTSVRGVSPTPPRPQFNSPVRRQARGRRRRRRRRESERERDQCWWGSGIGKEGGRNRRLVWSGLPIPSPRRASVREGGRITCSLADDAHLPIPEQIIVPSPPPPPPPQPPRRRAPNPHPPTRIARALSGLPLTELLRGRAGGRLRRGIGPPRI